MSIISSIRRNTRKSAGASPASTMQPGIQPAAIPTTLASTLRLDGRCPRQDDADFEDAAPCAEANPEGRGLQADASLTPRFSFGAESAVAACAPARIDADEPDTAELGGNADTDPSDHGMPAPDAPGAEAPANATADAAANAARYAEAAGEAAKRNEAEPLCNVGDPADAASAEAATSAPASAAETATPESLVPPFEADAEPVTLEVAACTPRRRAAKLAISVGAASKIGPRQQNDDAFAHTDDGRMFNISDGIGGAPHGDIASACVVNAAADAHDRGATLDEAFRAANDALIQVSEWIRSPDTGATLLLAERSDDPEPHLDFAWVGDSVAYLLHDGLFTLVTRPDRVDDSNALRTAAGYRHDMPALRASCPIEEGDRLLLCTDGVWETVSPHRMVELLQSSDNAPWIADSIAREAADTGTDNATAVVLIVGAEQPEDKRRRIAASQTPVLSTTPLCAAGAPENGRK